MTTRSLGKFSGEGFTSEVLEDSCGKVFFLADADIDADGANGQDGSRPAYTTNDNGSEFLANGGMGIKGGKVVGVTDWFKHIVILGEDGQPKVFYGARGVIASKTAYRYPGLSPLDPLAYVNSETVPYMVVPPVIISATNGAVMGCKCLVTNVQNGRSVYGMVADVGPRVKVGEVSIHMARLLGIPESPRYGGTNLPIIKYELWPGVVTDIKGVKLLSSRGTYS